jgi:biopolymer transport protein ExbD
MALMRIPTRTSSRTLGLNMTPMIDVVFQLIIFFLVSSHLARQEQRLVLPLPQAATGQEARDDNPAQLTVHVLADGTLHVAGRQVLPAALETLLAQRHQVHGAALAVRIRADRHVPYRHLEPVLVACSRAGIWNVSYVVQRREAPH